MKERKDLTIAFWRDNVNNLLEFQEKDILKGPGSVTNAEMEAHVKAVYEEFDLRRKHRDALLADQEDNDDLDD